MAATKIQLEISSFSACDFAIFLWSWIINFCPWQWHCLTNDSLYISLNPPSRTLDTSKSAPKKYKTCCQNSPQMIYKTSNTGGVTLTVATILMESEFPRQSWLSKWDHGCKNQTAKHSQVNATSPVERIDVTRKRLRSSYGDKFENKRF